MSVDVSSAVVPMTDEPPPLTVERANEINLRGIQPIVQQQPGVEYNAIKTMPFEAIRDELVARYANSPHVNAAELAACETRDQLWSVLNRRETRGASSTEFASAARARYSLEESGQLEELRKRIAERYKYVDPKTGEVTVADPGNKKFREGIKGRFKSQDTVEATLATAAKTRVLNNIATLNATSMMNTVVLTPEEKLLPQEEQQRIFEQKISTQVALVLAAQNELNSIVAAPDHESGIGLRPESLEFADKAVPFFPVEGQEIMFAAVQYAKFVFKSLVHWNAYPTLMFESRLRLLMHGMEVHRVTTTYNYNAFVHSMYMHLRNTDLVVEEHGVFLDEQELRCRQEQTSAMARRQEIATLDLTPEQKEVEMNKVAEKLKDVAFFAHSIALARNKHREKPPVILSPFAEYLNRPEQLGGRWNRSQIPEHSGEEIFCITQHASQGIDLSFNAQLRRIEDRYRDPNPTNPAVTGKAGAYKDFIRECWALNHTFSIESVRCFDLGLLLMYEKAVPIEYRFHMTSQPNIVSNSGLVLPEVIEACRKERLYYTAIRKFCAHYVMERIKEDELDCEVSVDGLVFPEEEVAASDFELIEPNQAASPVFGEYYRFYTYIATNYVMRNDPMNRAASHVMSFRADAADLLFSKLHAADGVRVKNWQDAINLLYEESTVINNNKRDEKRSRLNVPE